MLGDCADKSMRMGSLHHINQPTAERKNADGIYFVSFALISMALHKKHKSLDPVLLAQLCLSHSSLVKLERN